MKAEDFVRSYLEAWNHHDAQQVADHIAMDGAYYDLASHEILNRDQLIVELKDMFEEAHDRYDLIGDVLSQRNRIAFEYQMTPLDDRAEDFPIKGAEFITLRGNLAIRIDDYYEIASSGLNIRRVHKKYAKSGLSEAQLEGYKDKLSELMRNDRVYLDSNLTLPKLATLLGCPVNHLSQVINAGFGVSFFDFLNQYRVEDAIKLLTDPEQHRDILSIAFEVGFNSNSAFYTAFKKSCGMTPAKYRQSHRG